VSAVEDPLPRDEKDKVQVFIPAHLAAICANCEGTFLLTAGKCPGCGSHQWIVTKHNEKKGVTW
jgi:Zn finger protein HypA/HybF involved in hydrogenase expression